MNSKTTYVWGTCADQAGIVQHYSDEVTELPGGGVRVETRSHTDHEPAGAYARVHPSPMPMRWGHEGEIGRIIALRRAHDRLYAVAETELAPHELQTLAGEDGLRWSTGTYGRRSDPLTITEISLVREAATVGLPRVSWWLLDVTKGNPPDWVRCELKRAETRVEQRSRRQGALVVHDLDDEDTISADFYERRDPEHLRVEYLPAPRPHHLGRGATGRAGLMTWSSGGVAPDPETFSGVFPAGNQPPGRGPPCWGSRPAPNSRWRADFPPGRPLRPGDRLSRHRKDVCPEAPTR